MAKKIQNKRYLVNRAVYKAVKRYDHQQFENFCTDIYKSGWEDGKASVNALDVKDIEAVIRSVKGIGEARIGKIMEAINEKFDENAGSEETEVNDGVFSAGTMGEGFAIIPENETVYAPADATVSLLMQESRHVLPEASGDRAGSGKLSGGVFSGNPS